MNQTNFTLRLCLVLSVWLCTLSAVAQKNERDYIRSGNRLYRDSLYDKAEVEYRKAIEQNGRSSQAYFNLGNALLRQQKAKDAMEAYETAAKVETNRVRQSAIYHNMGVILQSQKQFAPAISCYKEALKRNPHDEETRYNLVLCQHQLKNTPQDQQQQQDKQQQGEGDQQDQQQQQQNQPQQQPDKSDEQKQQPQQPQEEEGMSKENIEQMLKAAMQDEKNTQEKVKRALTRPQRKRLQKEW